MSGAFLRGGIVALTACAVAACHPSNPQRSHDAGVEGGDAGFSDGGDAGLSDGGDAGFSDGGDAGADAGLVVPGCGGSYQPCCDGDAGPACLWGAQCAGLCLPVLGVRCGPDATEAPPCGAQDCITLSDLEQVCTIACGSNADCMPGWSCGDAGTCECEIRTEVCNGLDDDCDGIIDNQPWADGTCQHDGSGMHCIGGSCVCTGTRCANLAGACEDLSSDPDYCGSCENASCHDVITGGDPVCVTGTCARERVLYSNLSVTAQLNIKAIASDGTNIYFADDYTRKVYQGPPDGGAVITLGGDTNNYGAIAYDAQNVYWSDQAGIYSVLIGGGGATTMATANISSGGEFVLSGDHLYWNTSDGAYSLPTTAVNQTPAPQKLATATGPYGRCGTAVGGGNVYWVDHSGALVSVSTTGGTAVTLTTSPGGFGCGIVADQNAVYWYVSAEQDYTGEILATSIQAGTTTTLAYGLSGLTDLIVTDGQSLYWSSDEGKILTVPNAGGAVVTISPDGVGALAVDGNDLYWATSVGVAQLTPK